MWVPAQGEAKAYLPLPETRSVVSSGTLACEAQIWTLSLTFADGAMVAGSDGTATLSVPRGDHHGEAVSYPGGVNITVPHDALEPLMAATRLTIRLPNGTDEVRFPLTGSRRAIGAVQALCTPREMPGANSIALTPYSSYLELARALRKNDISDFQLSTLAQPALRAGMLEVDPDHRLLFAELCGSTWYYGQSGCGLAGFAAIPGVDQAKPQGWKLVFESEGVFLYVDPETSVGGWPVLRTIPLKQGFDETRWVFNGESFEPQGIAAAIADEPESEGSSE